MESLLNYYLDHLVYPAVNIFFKKKGGTCTRKVTRHNNMYCIGIYFMMGEKECRMLANKNMWRVLKGMFPVIFERTPSHLTNVDR